MKSFFDRVYEVVSQIPCGKVASYGQIARMLNAPRSAKSVGFAMRNCPENLPWYRVVKSDGSIAGGVLPELCRDLLKNEGITFLSDDRINMEQHQWNKDNH